MTLPEHIIDIAGREHVDMVVISTHGISGWHPLVFGSIAEKVVIACAMSTFCFSTQQSETHLKSASNAR